MYGFPVQSCGEPNTSLVPCHFAARAAELWLVCEGVDDRNRREVTPRQLE